MLDEKSEEGDFAFKISEYLVVFWGQISFDVREGLLSLSAYFGADVLHILPCCLVRLCIPDLI